MRAQPDDETPVDVVVELVGRGEARRNGFGIGQGRFDVSPDALRLDQLPPDVARDVSEKLDRARKFLEAGEIDKAVTLAHGVSWEHPSLVDAKVVISRALVLRGRTVPGFGESAPDTPSAPSVQPAPPRPPRRLFRIFLWIVFALLVIAGILWGLFSR